MEKIKYSRISYQGFIGLEIGKPFFVYEDSSPIAYVLIVDHKIGIIATDLNLRIKPTPEKGEGFYEMLGVNNPPAHTTLIDSNVMSRLAGSDFLEDVPSYSNDTLAIVFDMCPAPRILQNFFYTELLVCRFFDDAEDVDKFDVEQNILEKFVSKYREVTGDIYVKRPSESNWNFTGMIFRKVVALEGNARTLTGKEKLLLLNDINDLTGFAANGLQFDKRDLRKSIRPTYDYTSISEKLTLSLEENKDLDLFKIVLNRANEDIQLFDNYKLAFLDLFFYCELVSKKIVLDKMDEQSFSNNEKRKVRGSFSEMLRVLPQVLVVDVEMQGLMTDVDWVRTKRNAIVHDNISATESEAKRALIAIEKFIIKLNSLC